MLRNQAVRSVDILSALAVQYPLTNENFYIINVLAITKYRVFVFQQQRTAVSLNGTNGVPAQQLAEIV